MKAPAILLIAIVCLTSCQAQRTRKWHADIDFWLAEVKKQHYLYRHSPLPQGFDQRLRGLRSKLDAYTDQRILIELLGLSAMLGDGHTYVIPWSAQGIETRTLPFRLYLFSDGLFIIDAQPGFEEWIGKEITAIGSVNSEELMRRVTKYMSRDNEQGINWIGPVMLPLEGMLQALGAEGAGHYSLTFGDGSKHDFPLVPFRPVRGIPKLIPPRIAGVAAPLYLQQVDTPYWMKTLPASNAMYVQFNQVMDSEGESLAAFADRLRDSLVATTPQKVIVDVRHNNGGSLELLEPLLSVLEKFKSRTENPVYILTGRNTFSAAQIFINKAEKRFGPVFAGEISSSKPNFVGEENVVLLPNSQAVCSISNRYHETTPGDDRDAIPPQMRIRVASTDYFQGKDPVLDAVLK